jgi:hypothetical protein
LAGDWDHSRNIGLNWSADNIHNNSAPQTQACQKNTLMDSLQDVLGHKNFRPPDEISAIKEYILRRYKSYSRVKIEKTAIIVSVPSSTLAATIYLERQSMIEQCNLKQRLVIRSGH